MKTKIATLVLIPIIILLGYWLAAGIKGPLDDQRRIAQVEKDVIEKLKFIRELQVAYNSQTGNYAGKWEKLIDFAKNGNFLITQTREIEIGRNDSIRLEVDTLGRVSIKDSLLRKYPQFNVDDIPTIPHTKGKKFSIFAGKIENGNVLVGVFEIKDIYPINPARGAELKADGEAYSVPTLVKYFETKLVKVREDVVNIQKKMKNSNKTEKDQLQKELDELSKFVNLYDKRIEQLRDKPLRVGSRIEATLSGNWE